MEQYNQQIYAIRCKIFDSDWQEGVNLTIDLLSALLQDKNLSSDQLNSVSRKLMLAMQQKDYLLLADIVYFELPVLWQCSFKDIEACEKGEHNHGFVLGKFVFSTK